MKKLSFLCVAALLFASCASEDNANQSNKSQQNTTNVPTVTFVGYQPETTASAKTRTTATHELGKAAKVYWEDADYIWVKANNGQFYRSSLASIKRLLIILAILQHLVIVDLPKPMVGVEIINLHCNIRRSIYVFCPVARMQRLDQILNCSK